MGAVNPSWHRWVFASVAKHLHVAIDPSVELVVEFLDKRSVAWTGATTKAEATISGPATKEISPGLHRIWVDIFVKVTTNMGANNYPHLDAVGTVAEALDNCIICKDYGETGLVEIGILHNRPESGETVKVTNLTPTEKDTQIHSTISARFLGYFAE